MKCIFSTLTRREIQRRIEWLLGTMLAGCLTGLPSSGCNSQPHSVQLGVSQMSLRTANKDRHLTIMLSQPVWRPQLHFRNGRILSPIRHRGRFAIYAIPTKMPIVDNTAVLEARDPQTKQVLSASVEIPVDNTTPSTSVTASPGQYDQPISFRFLCSEPATIYYRIDGAVPSQQDPGIECNGTTDFVTVATSFTLQYFGVDAAGNAEPVRGASYVVSKSFFDIPASLEVVSDAESFRFTLTGESRKGVIYTIGDTQCNALERAAKANQPPPPGLPMRWEIRSSNNLSHHYFYGGAIEQGACFGLVIQPSLQAEEEQNGGTTDSLPGTPQGKPTDYPLSSMPVVDFVRLDDLKAPPFTSDFQRFERGVYWLASQSPQVTIGAASTVYRMYNALAPALNPADVRDRSRMLIRDTARRLESRIRSQRVRDIGEMSERILALLDSKWAPIEDIVNLVIFANETGGTITGWGAFRDYHPDVPHTALGILATRDFIPEVASQATRFFARPEFLGEEGYGWVAHQQRDLGVSALVYHTIDAPSERYQWLIDAMDAGNFGSALSTAMVLRFMAEKLPAGLSEGQQVSTLDSAKNELVSHQHLDGSWNQAPQLTAQALIGLGRYLCVRDEHNRCGAIGANQ